MLKIKTILHPTDFSERSQYAFRLACMLARDHGGRVVVLHVAIPPRVLALEGNMVAEPPLDEEALKEKLAAIQPDVPGVAVEHCLVVNDNAVGEVLRFAEETKPDVIVMGSHGRTGLKRALLGSVAELVLRRANCPVLTVKQPFGSEAVDDTGTAAKKRRTASTTG